MAAELTESREGPSVQTVSHPTTVRQRASVVRETLAGASAGLAATAPMTIAMEAIEPSLPPGERLPSAQEPLLIVDELLRRFGLEQELSERQKRRLTWCAHFAYGTACGVGYAWLGRRLPMPTAVRGAAYGLFVWALGYAGWLPALRILPPPMRRPTGRNVLLVASHLVWGVSASLVLERAVKGPKSA